jgi:hypothetical protein
VKVSRLLKSLGEFDGASAVVAATDLSDVAFGEFSTDRMHLLQYIAALPPTPALLDRLHCLFFTAVRCLPDGRHRLFCL